MKLAVAALAALVAAFAPAATAAGPSDTVRADVESVATVTSQVNVVFEFNLYDCPAGFDMEIVEWKATQPDRVDSLALIAAQPFGTSSGNRLQNLTVQTVGDFLAGLRWEGQGTVKCGPFLIPVEGAGMTQSFTGV